MGDKRIVGAVIVMEGKNGQGQPYVTLMSIPDPGNGYLRLVRTDEKKPRLSLQNWSKYDVTLKITDIDSGTETRPPKDGVFDGVPKGGKPVQLDAAGDEPTIKHIKLLVGIGPEGTKKWIGMKICIEEAPVAIIENDCKGRTDIKTFPPDVVVEC